MITSKKKEKMLAALKNYSKTYLSGNIKDLDESGTRLMINSFLTDILCYAPIEEIKTEYMIRGTYADYVIQSGGVRHFLIEVKALSLELSEKHLRQTVNYGANEGIEWALLTNGKHFEFYKILFEKPIQYVKVFSFDLSDQSKLKSSMEVIQHLHSDSVKIKGLDKLWNKNRALDPVNIAGYLFDDAVINSLKKNLKGKFDTKFSDEEIEAALSNLIIKPVNILEVKKPRKVEKKKAKVPQPKILENNV